MTDTAERLSLPEVPGITQEATLFDPGCYDVVRTLQFPIPVERTTDLSVLQDALDRLNRGRIDRLSAHAFVQLGSWALELVEDASVSRDELSAITQDERNRLCGKPFEVHGVASKMIALCTDLARKRSTGRIERVGLFTVSEKILGALEVRYPYYEVLDDQDYMQMAADIAAVYGNSADIRRALGYVDTILARRECDPTLYHAPHTFALTQAMRKLGRVDKTSSTAQRFLQARLTEVAYLNTYRDDGMTEPPEHVVLGLLQEVFVCYKDPHFTRQILAVAVRMGIAPTELQTRFLTERKGAGRQADAMREALGQFILNGLTLQSVLLDERC